MSYIFNTSNGYIRCDEYQSNFKFAAINENLEINPDMFEYHSYPRGSATLINTKRNISESEMREFLTIYLPELATLNIREKVDEYRD